MAFVFVACNNEQKKIPTNSETLEARTNFLDSVRVSKTFPSDLQQGINQFVKTMLGSSQQTEGSGLSLAEEPNIIKTYENSWKSSTSSFSVFLITRQDNGKVWLLRISDSTGVLYSDYGGDGVKGVGYDNREITDKEFYKTPKEHNFVLDSVNLTPEDIIEVNGLYHKKLKTIYVLMVLKK